MTTLSYIWTDPLGDAGAPEGSERPAASSSGHTAAEAAQQRYCDSSDIVEILTGEGALGNIIPTAALNTLTHLPTEFAGESYHRSADILHVEDGEEHSSGGIALLSLDFLPHNTADADIWHQNDVGQIFQMDDLLAHCLHVVDVQTLSVKGGVVDGFYHLERLVDLRTGHEGGVQILHNVVGGEERAEGCDTSAGHLVYLREHILQLEGHLAHRVLLHGVIFCGSDVAACLLFMYVVREVFLKLVPAGTLFAVV